LAGFFLGFIIPVVSAAIAHRYPPQIVGKLFAIAFGVSVFGASVGVAVGGTLLHYTNSFTWPVLVLVLVSALSFVLSALFVAKDSKDAQPCP
jgi:MFS family permease